jgi:hypothetical protein
MDVFWFWALLLLLLVAVFAWPSWPYTRDRGLYRDPGRRYAPSGVALVIALLLLLFVWFGLLTIWWPWAAYPVE